MEFLVNIQVNWPPEGDPDAYEALVVAERQRGDELVKAGTIRRLWRVPGRNDNWGLWRAEDATKLHQALASLPFFPWLDITVHPLARHPTDPGESREI